MLEVRVVAFLFVVMGLGCVFGRFERVRRVGLPYFWAVVVCAINVDLDGDMGFLFKE